MKKMPDTTVAELKKEMDDLKIRVNNLEKKMSKLSKPETKPRGQRFI
jgi:chaperonin cofactor prefoldin